MHLKTTTSHHYYPFGPDSYRELMPTRTWDAESSYRFGFNTQERVDEISGKGNHNTALFCEYDTLLGRRWNLDPKPQMFISDYACLGNNPIKFTGILGDIFGVKGSDSNNEKFKNYLHFTDLFVGKGKSSSNQSNPNIYRISIEKETNGTILKISIEYINNNTYPSREIKIY